MEIKNLETAISILMEAEFDKRINTVFSNTVIQFNAHTLNFYLCSREEPDEWHVTLISPLSLIDAIRKDVNDWNGTDQIDQIHLGLLTLRNEVNDILTEIESFDDHAD